MVVRQNFAEVYRDELREWRWRFCAWNGHVLADSGEGYKRLVDCVKMAQQVCGLSSEARSSDAWHRNGTSSNRRWYR